MGPDIRTHEKSGVLLEKEPFNLRFSKMEEAKGRELFVTKIYSA